MLNEPILSLLGDEQIIAGFDLAAPLDQFQRSQPAQGFVETPPLAS
jgi:hypothetical protein